MQKAVRTLILIVCDALLIIASYYVSYFLRFDGQITIMPTIVFTYPI